MAIDSRPDDSHQSKPVKRMRWATQRVAPGKALQKRRSIFTRNAARLKDGEEKRRSGGTDPEFSKQDEDAPDSDEGTGGRTIYFNIPLPASARDEEGSPLHHYPRNKIRTAKYTALSFIPKDLWLQFHNIANIYFLIIIILSVRASELATNDLLLTLSFLGILHIWCYQSRSIRDSANRHCRDYCCQRRY